jgi:hypothetical protein
MVLAAVTMLVVVASASANTITTVAGGGTQTPPYYDDPDYFNPLSVSLQAPTAIAWSGAPSGLFYVLPGNGQCVQLWSEGNSSDPNYGLTIEGGFLEDCNALTGGYTSPTPARSVKLRDPCCVTSDWRWDPSSSAPGPLVASSGTGHIQHYSWKDNTGVTVAGVAKPADCNDGSLALVGYVPPTDPTARFCTITALAAQFEAPFMYAFAERNRGVNQAVIDLVDGSNHVEAFPVSDVGAEGVVGMTWERNDSLIFTDGRSAIYLIVAPPCGGPCAIGTIAGSPGVAPNFGGDGGHGSAARFANPKAVAVGFDNALYVADTDNCRIRKLDKITLNQEGVVSTVAGNGCSTTAPRGDGGPSTAANLNHPRGVAMSSIGLLISDTGNSVVRLVDRTSIIDPPSVTADSTPAFDLRSLDTPSNILCEVDDSLVLCNAIGPLSDGPHKLEAWENGSPGDSTHPADPTPAVANFTVDTHAPVGVALQAPAADASDFPVNGDFSWSAGSDTYAGIDHYELWIGGSKNRDVPTSACSAGTCAAKAEGLTEGARSWQIRAVDGVGNTAQTETRAVSAGAAPTPAFTISPNPALAGRSVTFNGGTSADESGIARYEWDLDGDGAFETDAGASPTATRLYEAPTTITIRLRITDGVGKQATTQQQLRVVPPTGTAPLFGISINSGAQYTRTPEVTLLVKAPASATSILVSNDGGFLAPLTFPTATSVKWKLESSGPERLPKIVYARFMLGPIISENYTDDIILDEKPPIVDEAKFVETAAPAAGAAKAAVRAAFKLRVRARDSNSGVSRVQVTASKSKPGKLLRYRKRLTVRSATRPKFLRARDKAGNFSRWKKLK